MHTGSVHFIARTSGIQIDEFSVPSENPNIQDFVCSISEEGKIEITVNLDDVYYEEWEKGKGDILQEMRQFISVLSFEFDIPIRSLHQEDFSIKKNDGSGMTVTEKVNRMVWDILSGTRKPGNHAIENFKNRFKSLREASEVRIYSSAIRQEDPVARFMLLYNIILMFSGEEQVNVERSILSIAPDTPQTEKPEIPQSKPKQKRKPRKMETVYTRLRNEIAHNRGGEEFDRTCKEIDQWVSGLESIVKKMVLDKG